MEQPWLFLIQNDPILAWCYRMPYFGPWLVFVLSFTVQILPLAVIATRQKTFLQKDVLAAIRIQAFRNNDRGSSIATPITNADIKIGGDAFFSIQNAYLLVYPILNMAIFHYYENVSSWLWLFVVSHDPGAQQTFAAAFRPMTSLWPTVFSLLGFAIGAAVFTVFPTRNRTMFVREQALPRYDWLNKDGKARPISYLFSATCHVLQIAIIVGWIARHILLSVVVVPRLLSVVGDVSTMDYLHPDGLFGFGPFEEVTRSVTLVAAGLVLLVCSWLSSNLVRQRGWGDLVVQPGQFLSALGVCIVVPTLIVLTIEPCHRMMLEAKAAVLRHLDASAGTMRAALSLGDVNAENVRSKIGWITDMRSLRDQVMTAPTWPIRVITSAAMVGQILASAVFPFAWEWAIRRLQRRRTRD